VNKKVEATLPASLSDVAREHLERRAARIDPAAHAEDKKLQTTLAALKIKPWPALLDIERDFGGLRFAEESEAWLLGTYAMAKKIPKRMTTKVDGTLLVCVGGNDTGRLFADESGQIWDEDAVAGTLLRRAESMQRRLEKEAYGGNISELGQHSFKALAASIDADAGSRALGVPLVQVASDEIERIWQSDKLTVWRSTEDVRVFAKTAAALAKAVAVLERP